MSIWLTVQLPAGALYPLKRKWMCSGAMSQGAPFCSVVTAAVSGGASVARPEGMMNVTFLYLTGIPCGAALVAVAAGAGGVSACMVAATTVPTSLPGVAAAPPMPHATISAAVQNTNAIL